MKTILSILILLFTTNFTKAQTTAIPDANFEQELINLGYDDTLDGSVLTANITSITILNVASKNITSLVGIENFTSLLQLHCQENLLTSLDVSQNSQLTTLVCYLNQISALDLSLNSVLTFISCNRNQLTCLNVKNGTNTNMFYISAGTNPNLTCVEVDNVTYSNVNWTDPNYFNFDTVVTYSSNCNNACSNSTVSIIKKANTNLSIFPTPTTGSINIDLGGTLTNVKATLINRLGQVILSENYTSTDFINLDINAPNSIYFLRLEIDGDVITKKIIKE